MLLDRLNAAKNKKLTNLLYFLQTVKIAVFSLSQQEEKRKQKRKKNEKRKFASH